MSQATAARATRPLGRPSPHQAPPGRRLRVVSAPASVRSRAGVVLFCVAMLVAGLVALLLINIGLSHGSYQTFTLQRDLKELRDRKQTLTEEIAAAQAPQELARSARRLGMVPAPEVAFLRLSDGSLSGAAQPAQAAAPPSVVVKP